MARRAVNDATGWQGADATSDPAPRNRPEDRREENGVVYYDRGLRTVNGMTYRRLAVQTHFVERGDDYLAWVRQCIAPIQRPGDLLSISEKTISMCQDNVVEKKSITVTHLAKWLSHFAARSDHGVAMDEPYKLQLAINLAGRPRILLACAGSAVTKLFGEKGVFYKIAGHDIASIDGFYMGSAFEIYHDLALLVPNQPGAVCAEIEATLGLPVMLVDANDLSIDIFGTSPSCRYADDTLCEMIRDNPAGQSAELTPLILIRPVGGASPMANDKSFPLVASPDWLPSGG